MRLAIIVSHPIQYYSPWFRCLAAAMGCGPSDEWRVTSDRFVGRPQDGGWDSQQNALRVFYLWDFGVTEKTDKGFGKAVKWDVDLLQGYDHEFVPNVSKDPGTHWFGGLDNPDLLERVKAFAPDAVLQFGYNYKALIRFDLLWKTKRAPLLFRGDSHLLAEADEQSFQCSVFSFQREGIKRWLRRLGLRFLFKRFACFLAVGKANADYFRAHGVPESKIVRCPHVVDNEFFRREQEETRGPIDEETTGGRRPEAGDRRQVAWQPTDKRPRDQKRRGLRAELCIPEDELVFLFAGKLEEKKQPLQLLEAFLAADLPRATLLFVGSGELEGALRAKAEEFSHGLTRIDTDASDRQLPLGREEKLVPDDLGTRDASTDRETGPQGSRSRFDETAKGKLTRIEADRRPEVENRKTENCKPKTATSRGNIVFLEFQNQSAMPEVYRTGDVLVLPSMGRYETWGLAVNEAACCGLPAIVSSHVGCGPDLIKDSATGWVFEAGNVEALRGALEHASAERDRLPGAGKVLSLLVREQFNFDTATDALFKALRKLCESGR